MAIKFVPKRTKTIQEGEYIFKINGVRTYTARGGKEKIVLDTTPYDEDGNKYEDLDLWFNDEIGTREEELLDALGNPDDLEKCVGKFFRADVSFYKSYTNTYNFRSVE